MRATRLSFLFPVALASLLLLAPAAGAEQLVIQAIQFPEDRDIDVEFTAVHGVPGHLDGEVEYEDGDAEVRLDAGGMVPALAHGGDVTSYVVWAVPRGGAPESLGELVIFDGDERNEFTTDLKEFAVLVTLEEHPKVQRPSAWIAFQNLPTDEKGARIEPLHYESTGFMPKTADRIARLGSHTRAEWNVDQARRVYQLTQERNAEDFVPDRVRDAQVALGQAENFLDRGHEKKALDYAQRSLSASADALLVRDDELDRRAEMAKEQADRREKQRLARKADIAEERGDQLETALDASERSRLTLQQQATERERELETLQVRASLLSAEQVQAERQLDEAREELKHLDMDRQDARQRADELMAERARLSTAVGNLMNEQDELERQKQRLVAQQSELLRENQDLARQKAEAEAEKQRLADEKAAVIADLYGTLSEIADTRRTARGLVVSLPDILFDFDKATLKPKGAQTLAKLAGVAMLVSELEFSIEGHTDSIGTQAYNDWLSEARARSVADFLAQEGVSSARMETEGFGENQPVAPNDTDAGRQKNRRVEIVIDKDSLPGAPERSARLR